VLVECGFVRVQASDGREFTFQPSLGRIASLGSPEGIVELYAALHGPNAAAEAAYVLAGLCDQEDVTPLTGCDDLGDPEAEQPAPPRRVPGLMPAAEQIIIARHLLQHGICGRSRPDASPDARDGGKYQPRFDAAEFIAIARVHLGLSTADAEALSMTELQHLLDVKFPQAKAGRDTPTREEYDAAMRRFDELAAQRQAAAQPETQQ
jgi:hypothetical protein